MIRTAIIQQETANDSSAKKNRNEVPCPRAQDIDRHVGARLRERRIMLGLTQQQMAELIGVTYHQAHKCEKGINRIAAGRLSTIAQALGVEIGYFYEGMSQTPETVAATPQQRLLLELARSFIALPSRKHQEAICTLARALATSELADGPDLTTAVMVRDVAA
jgi:transcriptional regulator with XRE-family HTH domain